MSALRPASFCIETDSTKCNYKRCATVRTNKGLSRNKGVNKANEIKLDFNNLRKRTHYALFFFKSARPLQLKENSSLTFLEKLNTAKQMELPPKICISHDE